LLQNGPVVETFSANFRKVNSRTLE